MRVASNGKLCALESLDRRLRVEFRWRGDRFQHTISLDGVPAAASIEGHSDDPWPPSPPIQQLVPQQIDGRDVLLGVGAAGRSHWSVSIEPAQTPRSGSLVFEWACRTPEPDGWLGSSYRLAPSLAIRPTSDDVTSDCLSLSVVEGGLDSGLAIRPRTRSGRTVCWSYAIEIE
jgi:hypothetical protein